MNKTKNVPHEKLGQGEGVGGTPEMTYKASTGL